MTITEAVNYINAHTWSQWKLGLERTRELLRRLGDPQKKLRFVHVAGSNGKGSTCAMLESILREAGYVTGLYPSPYIEDFRERIQVSGEYITEEALCRITERVAELADSMEDHPTQFEIITAIGMVYFSEKKCDIVVLEVGLGGSFDSTNVIDAPEAAVITNIGLEHTEYLGNTLAEIAANKCGIIKPGSDVVCYENVPEVMEVVRAACKRNGCRLRTARFRRILPVRQSLDGQEFYWTEDGGAESPLLQPPLGREIAEEPHGEAAGGALAPLLRLSLIGEYQLHNAATALTVIEALRERGLEITEEAVRCGLEKVRWPARFEVLSKEPLFILDGGHNPQCAKALAKSLEEYLPQAAPGSGPDRPRPPLAKSLEEYLPQEEPAAKGRDCRRETAARTQDMPQRGCGKTKNPKSVFLIGMLADKDYERTIGILAPYAACFVCLTPDSPRAMPAAELAAYLQEKGFQAVHCEDVREGILKALSLAAGKEALAPRREPEAESAEREACAPDGEPDETESAGKEALAPRREAETAQFIERERPPQDCRPVIAFGSLYLAGALRREFPGAIRAFRESGASHEFDASQKKAGSLQEEKRRQRALAAKCRRELTEAQRREKSAAVCRALASLPELEKARTVLTYAASTEEVDLDELNEELAARGKRLCYPVVGTGGEMAAVLPPAPAPSLIRCQTPGKESVWRTGAFGIREPVLEKAAPVEPAQIDAVLVPCVAFDKKGGRCGHGKGFYDRFLAKLPKDVPKILIAFGVQEVEDVAMEETDVRMDLFVTEDGCFRLKTVRLVSAPLS